MALGGNCSASASVRKNSGAGLRQPTAELTTIGVKPASAGIPAITLPSRASKFDASACRHGRHRHGAGDLGGARSGPAAGGGGARPRPAVAVRTAPATWAARGRGRRRAAAARGRGRRWQCGGCRRGPSVNSFSIRFQ
jgi:hypothetical protein